MHIACLTPICAVPRKKTTGLEHELLAKCPQETAERVDGRGDAVALDARDRRLRGVCALREFLLSDVVALADAADELAGRGVSVVRHATRIRRMGVVSFCSCDTSLRDAHGRNGRWRTHARRARPPAALHARGDGRALAGPVAPELPRGGT